MYPKCLDIQSHHLFLKIEKIKIEKCKNVKPWRGRYLPCVACSSIGPWRTTSSSIGAPLLDHESYKVCFFSALSESQLSWWPPPPPSLGPVGGPPSWLVSVWAGGPPWESSKLPDGAQPDPSSLFRSFFLCCFFQRQKWFLLKISKKQQRTLENKRIAYEWEVCQRTKSGQMKRRIPQIRERCAFVRPMCCYFVSSIQLGIKATYCINYAELFSYVTQYREKSREWTRVDLGQKCKPFESISAT